MKQLSMRSILTTNQPTAFKDKPQQLVESTASSKGAD
jgi:hypothetical protein